jgi:PhzF family phenazine biosynthesis protein
MRLTVVDAFTDVPFRGNPAAVVPLAAPAPAVWMQQVAAEANLSETAFPIAQDGASSRYALRWFTPAAEVALCGHATLATAHVLWQDGHVADGAEITFATASGELRVSRDAQGVIWLDFPTRPASDTAPIPGLIATLGGASGRLVGTTADPPADRDALVELDDPATLRGLTPDTAAIAALPLRALIVTSPADTPGIDFLSRFFAPAVGVAEDPVTGSAHCVLTPHWAARLGRSDLRAEQASTRGGRLALRDRGARTHIGGRAVTMLTGELRHEPPPGG